MSMFEHEQELQAAFDAALLATGHPPSKILVGKGDPPASDVAVVSMVAWREVVRCALRDMLDGWPTEEELVVTLTMPGWKYRGVPVTVRATADRGLQWKTDGAPQRALARPGAGTPSAPGPLSVRADGYSPAHGHSQSEHTARRGEP